MLLVFGLGSIGTLRVIPVECERPELSPVHTLDAVVRKRLRAVNSRGPTHDIVVLVFVGFLEAGCSQKDTGVRPVELNVWEKLVGELGKVKRAELEDGQDDVAKSVQKIWPREIVRERSLATTLVEDRFLADNDMPGIP